MIYLGSDHQGFHLKQQLKPWLNHLGYDFLDLGAPTLDPDDDYPFYASKVATAVLTHKNNRGILLCGSGVGVDIVANKFDGIRASLGKSVHQIQAGRADDDMNILVLAASFTQEKEAQDLVQAFLETKFSAKKRFKKRLQDITEIERHN